MRPWGHRGVPVQCVVAFRFDLWVSARSELRLLALDEEGIAVAEEYPRRMNPGNVWRELDDESAWRPFGRRFAFSPNYRERIAPAIELPAQSLVVDLSPVFAQKDARFAAGGAAINAVGDELVGSLAPNY